MRFSCKSSCSHTIYHLVRANDHVNSRLRPACSQLLLCSARDFHNLRSVTMLVCRCLWLRGSSRSGACVTHAACCAFPEKAKPCGSHTIAPPPADAASLKSRTRSAIFTYLPAQAAQLARSAWFAALPLDLGRAPSHRRTTALTGAAAGVPRPLHVVELSIVRAAADTTCQLGGLVAGPRSLDLRARAPSPPPQSPGDSCCALASACAQRTQADRRRRWWRGC